MLSTCREQARFRSVADFRSRLRVMILWMSLSERYALRASDMIYWPRGQGNCGGIRRGRFYGHAVGTKGISAGI